MFLGGIAIASCRSVDNEANSMQMPPKRVGRYAIYGQFARGGTATVHFGRLIGPEGFARTVAIKRLRPSFAGEAEFTRMLIDEARLVARISHQCVVPTLDVLVCDSVTYVVMEYIRGVALSLLFARARARRQPMDPCIVASIVANALHGLHAAHEAKDELGKNLGIVHRDVSPQNILVGADGVARVLDFGIAKAVTATQATRSGYVKGKFAYMAPEQLTGGQVDRRADVFATSVVLWELLTGERLFGGGSITGAIRKITSGGDEAPSTRAPRLGAEWDELTRRGLERDKELRFASAREMALELEASSPMAPASEIGEWVFDLAGDVLRARDEELWKIEALSTSDAGSSAEDATDAISIGRSRSPSRGEETTVVNVPERGVAVSRHSPSPDDGASEEEGVAEPTARAGQATRGAVAAAAGGHEGANKGDGDDSEGEELESEPGDESAGEDGSEHDPGEDEADEAEADESDGDEGDESDSPDDEAAEDSEEDDGGDDAAEQEDPRNEDTLRFRIRQGVITALGLGTILLATSFGIEHVTGKPASALVAAWVPLRAAAPVETNAEAVAGPTPGVPAAIPAAAPVERTDAGISPPRKVGASASDVRPAEPSANEPSPVAETRAVPVRRAERLALRRSEKTNCEPPYEVDTTGVTIFKVECL